MRALRRGLFPGDASWSLLGCCRTRRRGRSVDVEDLADSLLWIDRIVCAFHVARTDLDPQDLVLMTVCGTRTALQTWTLTARS